MQGFGWGLGLIVVVLLLALILFGSASGEDCTINGCLIDPVAINKVLWLPVVQRG